MFKRLLLGTLLLSVFSLTGCKQIFLEETDSYAQVELSKDQLEQGIFYVKSGTKFIKVWKPELQEAKTENSWENTKVAFLYQDYKTVPTLYKNEILAITSDKTTIKPPIMTRYKEIGYSMGFYGLTMDEEGYLCGTLNKNLYKEGPLYEELEKNAPSKDFRLVSINKEPVALDMLTKSSSAAFNCMEKDKEYQFEFYAGTYFYEHSTVANVFMLEQFETYELEEGESTKNGYISFHMPEGAKSGWYYLEGSGMFRYIDSEKGIDITTVDMNEEFYVTNKEKIKMYSQKFSTTLDVRRTDVSIQFYFTPGEIAYEEIQGYAYAPDGTEYKLSLSSENNYLYCDLKEAMAGKWEIFIQPKDLTIENMEIVSNTVEAKITEETISVMIEQDETNYYFNIPYEGEGEIYAILVGPDNEMYQFTTYEKDKYMAYLAPFLKEGEYVIKVYHYMNTKIGDLETQQDTKTETEIITITE